MLSGMNPQSENEIHESIEDAQKHPDMWLMLRQNELGMFRRRWFDLPGQEGKAEVFFRMVEQHLDMAYNALYMLRQEREDKALKQSVALQYLKSIA